MTARRNGLERIGRVLARLELDGRKLSPDERRGGRALSPDEREWLRRCELHNQARELERPLSEKKR